MNYAEKIFKKKLTPYDAWGEVPMRDQYNLSHTESLLKIDDFVLAVLEKNKEGRDKTRGGRRTFQSRAFRELVEQAKKVKKQGGE